MPVKIYFQDDFQLVDDLSGFARDYNCITAGGGVILNDEDKILLIFRRGKWDLPKGKLDPGETIEECAAREVKEETGLAQLRQEKFLTTTFHTYQQDGQPVLKDTHWYLFRAPENQPLSPQTEEDISEVVWAPVDELHQYMKNTYPLIRDVLETVIP